MNGVMTWQAFTFIAGLVVGTVVWTYWFWNIIPSRREFEKLEQRVRELEDAK